MIDFRLRLRVGVKVPDTDQSLSLKQSVRPSLRPTSYLDKGGKPAGATCNLQHFYAFPLGVSAP